MNLRTILLLVFALGAAGATAFVANAMIGGKSEPVVASAPAQASPKIFVLVAKEELPTGTFIKPDALTWQQWPEDGVREGYLVQGQSSESDLEGAVVRTRLFAGEPITSERVVHPGEQGFLAAVLEPGKRAVSVPVDATRGVAGFVFPGDWVDVVLSMKTQVSVLDGDKKEKETRYFSETLLPGVRVLGIDQLIDNTDGLARVAKTATLEVTSKQAEAIAIALEIGTLSLSLHSLVREDMNDAEAAKQHAGVTGDTRNFTHEMDVLSMIGDPLGLPMPSGLSSQLTVLRGGEASSVRF
jgi:pilus assembly protein CpaB